MFWCKLVSSVDLQVSYLWCLRIQALLLFYWTFVISKFGNFPESRESKSVSCRDLNCVKISSLNPLKHCICFLRTDGNQQKEICLRENEEKRHFRQLLAVASCRNWICGPFTVLNNSTVAEWEIHGLLKKNKKCSMIPNLSNAKRLYFQLFIPDKIIPNN